jgi:ABC-type multidrug transport system ATPase subunit
MQITLTHISKRFQRYWIFRDISYSFSPNNAYCLLGANGSGKSTLMRVIAGMQNPSKGKVQYTHGNGAAVGPTEIYKNISFCAPGMEIVEELTLQEYLSFRLKSPYPGWIYPPSLRLQACSRQPTSP